MSGGMLVLMIAWMAGLTAVVGGTIAWLEGSDETPGKRVLVHAVIAFGGGTLLAAVSFALVPEAAKTLEPLLLTVLFLAGAVVFMVLDVALARAGGSRAQFLAMMMDFAPESLSLGAVFIGNHKLGYLLAGLIGIQNLPEGFNAFREMVASGRRPRSVLLVLAVASLTGPAAAWLGYTFLQDSKAITASVMAFASGGIVYLIFQDIAPQASMRRHPLTSMGAVLGFLLGLLGNVLLIG
ncbi:divalent cation transporter [uncultured Abyssibacter sp.]|uniref:ZIP family metal transporter n=1 Tax=uncultured Abyssibacter sp. TaxID=2320202 RepID=UPI0032B1B456